MEEKTLAERLEALEKRPSGKSVWDKLDVLAKIMVPLAVAVSGYVFSQALKDRDIRAAAELKDRDIAVASVNSRVQQAALINTFMEALVSESAPRRQLAISAIMIALPQEGPELVRVVSASPQDSGISKFAKDALTQRRDYLIHRMFADSADVRISASSSLLQGWRSHPELVPVLLDTARGNLSNLNGIYNTIGLLNGMDAAALVVHRAAIEAFVRQATAGAGKDKIRALANELRRRAN